MWPIDSSTGWVQSSGAAAIIRVAAQGVGSPDIQQYSAPVTDDSAKRTLHGYLCEAREAMVWKLDGLSEYGYRRVWLHTDATINDLPADAPGHVRWWPRPDVTLHTMLVHVLAETNRHAGHADILREKLDGAAGMRADNSNVAEHDPNW